MKGILAALCAAALLCPICQAAEAPTVSAAAAVLMEADSGRVLYESNIHEKRSIASITKLMTALVAVESESDLEKKVTVKAEYQAEGSSMYLRVGEELTLEALLYGLILSSGNDAALAIAGSCAGDVETFVEWMNLRAQELGMENTHFANPNGLDDEEHYSTAYDMALLTQAVLENETVARIVATRSISIAGRALTNHNKLLWRYEGCNGMKTGYTDTAGRTLISTATREGQTLICVTLRDPNDWDDHMALLDYGFENWNLHPLTRPGKVFRTLRVEGSLLPQVAVETSHGVSYPLRAEEQVRVRVTLPDRVDAPVSRGAIAGKLTFLLGEEPIGETYLLYAGDVPEDRREPTFFERMIALLQGEEAPALGAMMMNWR